MKGYAGWPLMQTALLAAADVHTVQQKAFGTLQRGSPHKWQASTVCSPILPPPPAQNKPR